MTVLPASPPPLYTLATPGASAEPIGGKARNLIRLRTSGFPVPPGVVIPPSTATDGPTLRALAAALEGVGPGPYAVRSSANVEDGPLRSYAGQFETILGVQAADLAEAIQRVRGSASALRSSVYAGADLGPIAVIVQQLVPADCAGVAFTADPDTGERDVVRIEAVHGLGDRLVSGEVDPETWVVRDEQTERTRSGPTHRR